MCRFLPRSGAALFIERIDVYDILLKIDAALENSYRSNYGGDTGKIEAESLRRQIYLRRTLRGRCRDIGQQITQFFPLLPTGIKNAIAASEKTQVVAQSAIDRFLKGNWQNVGCGLSFRHASYIGRQVHTAVRIIGLPAIIFRPWGVRYILRKRQCSQAEGQTQHHNPAK